MNDNDPGTFVSIYRWRHINQHAPFNVAFFSHCQSVMDQNFVTLKAAEEWASTFHVEILRDV